MVIFALNNKVIKRGMEITCLSFYNHVSSHQHFPWLLMFQSKPRGGHHNGSCRAYSVALVLEGFPFLGKFQRNHSPMSMLPNLTILKDYLFPTKNIYQVCSQSNETGGNVQEPFIQKLNIHLQVNVYEQQFLPTALVTNALKANSNLLDFCFIRWDQFLHTAEAYGRINPVGTNTAVWLYISKQFNKLQNPY